MMKKNKMLVIPGGFVPYNDTVTLICYKHLRNLDCMMDVVALKGKEDQSLTKELEKDLNWKKFNIEYICNYEQAVATAEKKNILEGIYNILRYCFFCVKKLKQYSYDFVYSSSIPAFTHLAAYFVNVLCNIRLLPGLSYVF